MITEKDYNSLAKDVYDVESGKVPDPIRKGDLVGNDKFVVIDCKDNTSNGMQAMAVAPIMGYDSNGRPVPDTSQIVLAYAGTNSADSNDKKTDVQSIGLGSDTLNKSKRGFYYSTDSQFVTAKEFAENIQKDYPNATITTTGHSLGESEAMYVALKLGLNNVGYNGPDIYQLLSNEEVKYMQKHQGQFKNYRNPHDKIGNVTGNKTKSAIYVDQQNGNILDDHTIDQWQFKDGCVVDRYGNIINIDGAYQSIRDDLHSYMTTQFKNQKARLSSGGYTSHEMIYLDYLEASAAASSLALAVQLGDELVKTARDNAVKEENDVYKSLKKRPASVDKLSIDEILEVYREEGVSYRTLVTDTKDHFEKKVADFESVESKFTALSGQIESGIQGMIEADQSLANDIAGFVGWGQG